MNTYIKSQFHFNRSQRIGIFSLVFTIVAVVTFQQFIIGRTSDSFDLSSTEFLAIQRHIDSVKCLEAYERKPIVYPFNPNFISEYKAYTLGMSLEAYDRLKEFRAKDQWINSAADFQRVTGVPDSTLNQIKPYFKFPEWVNKPRQKRSFSSFNQVLTEENKTDLNRATAEQLTEVYGVGTVLSERIVAFREKLGGFNHLVQLHAVYGLRTEVINRIEGRFSVKTPVPIHRMNVNTVSASDLSTLPGMNFETAKKLWEFIRLREGIKSLEELQNFEGISPQKLALITLYLSVE